MLLAFPSVCFEMVRTFLFPLENINGAPITIISSSKGVFSLRADASFNCFVRGNLLLLKLVRGLSFFGFLPTTLAVGITGPFDE